ncbi:DNA-processing protein DprA [Actinoplanes sp. CA-131856]
MTTGSAGSALQNESLTLALTAFISPRTPTRISSELAGRGREGLRQRFRELPLEQRTTVLEKAADMAHKGIDAVLLGDENYPHQLGKLSSTSPVLFYWGNVGLFKAPSIGMCGSRNVSELGLKAARACGEEAESRGIVVVSGYAKGVDTETHLAALERGGQTIIVLAEGFDHFRIKKAFTRSLFKPDNVLVVSQFPPTQRWMAGAAMTRNKIIYGLGMALVVIEAGEKGGTLAAGEGALSAHRRLFVLDFGGSTPPGNRILLDKGGVAVSTRTQLGLEMQDLYGRDEPIIQEQMSLI